MKYYTVYMSNGLEFRINEDTMKSIFSSEQNFLLIKETGDVINRSFIIAIIPRGGTTPGFKLITEK